MCNEHPLMEVGAQRDQGGVLRWSPGNLRRCHARVWARAISAGRATSVGDMTGGAQHCAN